MKFYPSIFNDCLSPIYPGPSSSNTAAPYRLGIMAAGLLEGRPVRLYGEMSEKGGYYATFYGMHSDKAFLVGVLEKDMRTYDFEKVYEEAKVSALEYSFAFTDNVPPLPSEAAWVTLTSDTGDRIFLKTVSLGGGEISIDEVDGLKTSLDGKYYYMLVRVNTEESTAVESILPFAFERTDGDGGVSLITARSRTPYEEAILEKIRALSGVAYVRCVDPVYDIIPVEDPDMPFATAKEMFDYVRERNIPVWQAALDYERAISGLDDAQLMSFAEDLWDLTVKAAEEGYKVTAFDGAITDPCAAGFRRLIEQGKHIPLGVADMAAADACSVKEYGAAHGIIAGMPAGGAAGVPVSAIRHSIEALGLTKEDGLKALMTAAILGIFYYPTHYHGAWGCQAEVGISISITAGALASLITDDVGVIERAAVLGAQSVLGVICDPIDGAGQVPCFLRNITAVPTAIVCANAAAGGCEGLTNLDEMVETMLRVGHKLKTCGINDLGICYYNMQKDETCACS